MGYGNGKSKPKKKERTSEAKFRFINYHLSKKDEEWLEAADLDTEFDFSLVRGLVEEGYKFSLSNDERNHTFVASITDRQEGSPFYNACLTGRGSTPLDAWYALAYRHLVLAQMDWSFFGDGSNGPAARFG